MFYVDIMLLPGMGFRPMISIDSTLIEFNSGDNDSFIEHIKNIEELLKRMSIMISCLFIFS